MWGIKEAVRVCIVLQAIFIAHGPYFKKNYTAESFENIQLYSLMCGKGEDICMECFLYFAVKL